jgi:autoinducer 2 (AI-2) kinase
MGKYLLAIDAGTGACRCVMFDYTGREISRSYREWSYTSPEGLEPLGKEFDPEHFWSIIRSLIRETMLNGGVSKEEIAGVSSTSQGQGAVFLDRDGKELYGGPNVDARGFMVQDIIDDILGQELYEIAGHAPYLIFIPSRLLWFREYKPEVYARIAHVLSINDWIIYRLSGAFATEPATASNSLLFDISKREWSKKVLEALDIPYELLPDLRMAGEVAGEVKGTESGLKEGTPVIIGGPDIECGLLSCRVFNDGDAGAVLGTTAPVRIALSEPLIDREGRTWSSAHMVKDRWTIESNAQMAGMTYRWLRDRISGLDFESMDLLAEKERIGSNNTYAFLGPEIMNAKSMQTLRPGAFLFPSPTNPVNEPIGLGNLARATLESVAYAVRANLEQLVGISAKKVDEAHVCGGMTKSRVFLRILSDVLNLPLSVPKVVEASALGCAMCASVGVGAYGSIADASASMTELERILPERPSEYEEHYRKWLSLYVNLLNMR